MTNLGIRVYTDEDVNVHLVRQLQALGYDIVSCRDEGNAAQGHGDEWQLQFAVRQGRAILTYNIADFMALDTAWKASGRRHHGIIVAENSTPIGQLVRRTRHHLDTVSPEYQRNMLLYLARID